MAPRHFHRCLHVVDVAAKGLSSTVISKLTHPAAFQVSTVAHFLPPWLSHSLFGEKKTKYEVPTMRQSAFSLVFLVLVQATTMMVTSFTTVSHHQQSRHGRSSSSDSRIRTSLAEEVVDASSSHNGDGETAPSADKPTTTTASSRRQVSVPLSLDEMVRQAASAIRESAAAGQTKQIVRVLLPRDASSGDFGRYLEGNAMTTMDGADSGSSGNNNVDIMLVPPDESWQGGIMQLYRAAAPLTETILRRLTTTTAPVGLPPRVTQDRSVDESGVDGVGLFRTDDGKVACWLQPTQENMDEVEAMAGQATGPDDVVILLNPQWRLVDDALDTYSKNEGFLGGLASFLGGKGGSLRRLKEAGFNAVYTLEGYVCRGANVRMMQVLDSDWNVFCERDNGESYICVGSKATRPTYADVEGMLQDSDIGYKYARDMGLQPKL